MSNEKLQWTKPQLIILARGTPEEAVLTHCKRIDNTGIGDSALPNSSVQTNCNRGPSDKDCGACQSRSGS